MHFYNSLERWYVFFMFKIVVLRSEYLLSVIILYLYIFLSVTVVFFFVIIIILIIVNNEVVGTFQQLQFGVPPCCGWSVRRCPCPPATSVGSESKLSDILSQIMSTSRSNTFQTVRENFYKFFFRKENLGRLTLTLIFSFADVSKNSTPNWSASCLPRSNEMIRSSSISHLFPTKITCALSHEQVLICVTLK